MKLSLYDLHCDTALEMYKCNKSFFDNDLSVSYKENQQFHKYTQTMEICSEHTISDEDAFVQFLNVRKYLYDDLAKINLGPSRRVILAVEDARLLAGKLDRLDLLSELGVKILTLTWSGISCIGGAFDTDVPLTDFGRAVVSRCFDLGIVPDISHASRKVAANVFEINTNNKPIIASHSDAYSVHPHPRNLTDTEFEQIKKSRGLVGINLYCEHLGVSEDSPKAIDKVIEHIDHYLSLGGEDTVCLGCDFDGALTPKQLKTVGDLTNIADRMIGLGYCEQIIEKIFSKNAEAFIENNF